MTSIVLSFNELRAEDLYSAGGKGGMLAKLYQSGYPVPEGFVILPAAFSGDSLTDEAWRQVQGYLQILRKSNGSAAFAVRSSALSEDSAQASFAGEFETVLDVHTDDAIRAAIHTVQRSRSGERAKAYSQARGMQTHHKMSVVVQRLIRADISGVIFTADPLTASHMQMVGNFVFGFGEELVSGEAEPYTFKISKPGGHYEGPLELKKFAKKLYKLAHRLEEDLGCPQDIEWCVADGKVYLLQSRPVTTLIGYNPATGEWNDTLTGDFFWSNTNLMEAVPDVMTPLTHAIWQIFHTKTAFYIGQFRGVGNICGRPYVNISLLVSFFQAMGKNREEALQEMMGTIGDIPEDIHISQVPIRRIPFLLEFLPKLIKRLRLANRILKEMPAYITNSPQVCERHRMLVGKVESKDGLISLWRAELEPYFLKSCWMLRVSARKSIGLTTQLTNELTGLVGESDTNALLSHMAYEGDQRDGSGKLESMGPMINLARLANGEINRQAYLERYGHRGPHECELSYPSPAEEPVWLENQLADYQESPFDVEAMLSTQREAFRAAWSRFQDKYPKKSQSMERSLVRAADEARRREAVRSEFTRFIGVIRAFALKAGELTGLGEDIFFLDLDELLDVLDGEETAVAYIPARRETHAKYAALPPYPALINGRFDPFEWASDPQRRGDYFDSHITLPPPYSDAIKGFPGAAGRVEGYVRRLDHAEDGADLRPGEILVTATTNIGWTPLFPRAGAIVTDVGAPLSHAAIVARELGIPAVVGCGNATTRLQTGDLVLVDGGNGQVKIIEKS